MDTKDFIALKRNVENHEAVIQSFRKENTRKPSKRELLTIVSWIRAKEELEKYKAQQDKLEAEAQKAVADARGRSEETVRGLSNEQQASVEKDKEAARNTQKAMGKASEMSASNLFASVGKPRVFGGFSR